MSWTFTIGLCLLIMGLFKTTGLWPFCIGAGLVMMAVAFFGKGETEKGGSE